MVDTDISRCADGVDCRLLYNDLDNDDFDKFSYFYLSFFMSETAIREFRVKNGSRFNAFHYMKKMKYG